MQRFLIVRDGPDASLEYRSRGAKGTSTGGGWTAKMAEAAKWTSAETAEKALATLKAEHPEDVEAAARVFGVLPAHTRGEPVDGKTEKPAKGKAEKKAKAPARQRAPRRAKVDKMLRYECTFCHQYHKSRAMAETCRCEASKAARRAGTATPANEVRLNGLGTAPASAGEPAVSREPVEATP